MSRAARPVERALPRLCRAVEASREINVPYTTLRDAVFRGELPVVKIGRAWYFDTADIARWIDSQKEQGR